MIKRHYCKYNVFVKLWEHQESFRGNIKEYKEYVTERIKQEKQKKEENERG